MMISSGKEKIESVDYIDERELQRIVGNAPDLVDEYNKLYTVCGVENELRIIAGNIDLFMISETGDVVVVETKLARNRESRREVIAQIIDYISSLAELSYYELDNATKNRLGEVIDDIETEIDLPKIIDDNLRNGRIKLIIAVDESNENLTRLTQFLADHTDFAVGLVEIRKYKDSDRELYVSTDIVKRSEAQESKRITGDSEGEKAKHIVLLDEIAEKWNEKYPEMLATYIGSYVRYRQISILPLPKQYHYEFLTYKNGYVLVRFDNEFTENPMQSARVSNAMKQFDGAKLSVQNNTYAIEFRNSRSKHATGQLVVRIEKRNISETVSIMEKLIKLTADKIKAAYEE